MLSRRRLNLKNALKISLPALAMLGQAHANTMTKPLQLLTPLAVSQEPGPINPLTPEAAGGEGLFIYDKSSHILHYKINFYGLSGAPTMAHFHLGPKHSNGPVIQMICGEGMSMLCPKQNSGVVEGSWKVPDEDVKSLLSGGIFVNFHTQLNPAGEIRGQLAPE